jgi:hypothetical protein
MSRQIPTDRPLSDEDRAYLTMRGNDARIAWFDQLYPPADEAPADEDDAEAEEAEEVEVDEDEDDEDDEADDEDPDYESWAVADLKAEIDKRNKNLGDDAMSVTGVKADLAKRLRENDAANA